MRLLGTAAFVLAVAAGLSGQQPTQLRPELASASSVTIRFRNADLTDALELVQGAFGITIQTTPEVKDAPKVNAVFKNARFTDVVKTLLGPAGLTFKVIDEKTILVFKAIK